MAESAAPLPDPPAQPDSGEEVASTYWYEQALADLLDRGFLLELENNSFRVSDLKALSAILGTATKGRLPWDAPECASDTDAASGRFD